MSDSKENNSGISIPEISLPCGGGALKGVDEKFNVCQVNGSASLSIAVPVSEARGFAPALTVDYSSASGGGPFGLGWTLSIPEISRRTQKRLPRYDDSDVFIMSGAEELVSIGDGRFIPRTGGNFSRIVKLGDGGWKILSPSNELTLYGSTENSRLADPSDPSKVFKWFPELSYDNRGNCVLYRYRHDGSQVYPDRIYYGSRHALYPGDGVPVPEDFLFCMVFDYGEYDLEKDKEEPVGEWSARPDSFSDRRAGFEIRTSRLCHNILAFSLMDEVPGGRALLASLHLEYDSSASLTLLASSTLTSYRKAEDGSYSPASIPSTEYNYAPHVWNREVKDASCVFSQGDRFFDYKREGLPGILHEDRASGEIFFQSNLGLGRFSSPAPVASRPSSGSLALLDLEGNGEMKFADITPAQGGFYEIGEECPRFTPFTSLPNVGGGFDNIRFVDLDGDGRAEMLVSGESLYMWYPSLGTEGWAEALPSSLSADGADGPEMILSERDQSLFLADMTGDGLMDIVRVKATEVYYYPNLGYGRFGEKRLMASSPVLDSPEDFNPSYVRLADIDGTGTADLVYLGHGEFRCWLNACGNAYSSEPVVIDTVPFTGPVSEMTLCDILGNGTSCLVWTSLLPQDDGGRAVRFINLMAGTKPYVLTSWSNSLGKEVRLGYTPSTEFYLKDRESGEEWKTKLPFPVQCVSRTEVLDSVTQWRFVTSYRYRDGYYDSVEREFRGFGTAECIVTDLREVEDLPPQKGVRTRTSVHLGIPGETDGDIFEDLESLTCDERRQAWRALKGAAYRTETYQEGDAEPCRVAVSTYRVRRLRPADGTLSACFAVMPYESFSSLTEDDPGDPRISQSIVLSCDEYGNPLRSVSISYGRSKPAEGLDERVKAAQAEDVVILTENSYSNDIDTDEVLQLRVLTGTSSRRLTGLEKPSSGFFSASDFPEEGCTGLLLGRSASRFLDSDLTTVLPEGEISSPLISAGSSSLVFPTGMLEEIYGGRISPGTMVRSGYILQSDGWWTTTGRIEYIKDGETPEDARRRFYMPLRFIDRSGAVTVVEYGGYCLYVASVTNHFGNTRRVTGYDALNQAPVEVEDENGNRSAVIFNVLGLVKARAVMGCGGEADSLEGFTVETSAQEAEDEKDFFAESQKGASGRDRLTALAKKLLGKASCRYLYDFDSVPMRCATLTRERHYADDPDSPVRISFEYFDGSGTAVLVKGQAEPDPEIRDGSAPLRWIGTGRTVVNSRGLIVKHYEPYFSDSPRYENADELVATGVSPVLTYDALGRKLRTDFPDGTFESSVIHTWSSEAWSCGDNVLQSDWYGERISADPSSEEYRAAKSSEVYAGTPVIVHADSVGRQVQMCEGELSTFSEYDGYGRLAASVDARGIVTRRYGYDLVGRELWNWGPDSGRRLTFPDVEGRAVMSWNDRGQRAETEYDIVGRPVLCRVVTEELQEGEEALDNVTGRWLYGEDLLASRGREALRKDNLLGRVVSVWDTAGLLTTPAYDFKGAPLRAGRRLAKDPTVTVNWTDDALESALSDELMEDFSKADALGRLLTKTSPDGSVTTFRYNEGGLLCGKSVLLAGESAPRECIRSIEYDAKRQRTRICLGNGTSTRYAYDPLTQRMTSAATHGRDGSLIQDLRYSYDAGGKLLGIVDASTAAEFHGNSAVPADTGYRYDSYGRLVEASGRENAVVQEWNCRNFSGDRWFEHMVSDPDPAASRAYTERYEYDGAGNILSMKHSSASDSWTRRYEYAPDSNRLLSTSVGDCKYEYEYHPRHGFMMRMPHLNAVSWDFLDRMRSSSTQIRNDGGTPETTYYQYGAGGERIRKVTYASSDNGEMIMKDERIYLGGYELYRSRSGSTKGLERRTLNVTDDRRRVLMIEVRNDVDDGTDKVMERYQLSDHISSVSIELDGDGRLIEKEEYTPYGQTAWRIRSRTVRAASRRYRFTGMERDDETGLSYHTARYYIPWLGRWLSCDPIGAAGGMNLYCYCANDPVTRSDTAGTSWDDFWFGLEVAGEVLQIAGGVLLVAAVAGGTAITFGTLAVAAPVAVGMGSTAIVHGADSLKATIANRVDSEGGSHRDDVGDNFLHHSAINAITYGVVKGYTGSDEAGEIAGTVMDIGVGIGSGLASGGEQALVKAVGRGGNLTGDILEAEQAAVKAADAAAGAAVDAGKTAVKTEGAVTAADVSYNAASRNAQFAAIKYEEAVVEDSLALDRHAAAVARNIDNGGKSADDVEKALMEYVGRSDEFLQAEKDFESAREGLKEAEKARKAAMEAAQKANKARDEAEAAANVASEAAESAKTVVTDLGKASKVLDAATVTGGLITDTLTIKNAIAAGSEPAEGERHHHHHKTVAAPEPQRGVFAEASLDDIVVEDVSGMICRQAYGGGSWAYSYGVCYPVTP